MDELVFPYPGQFYLLPEGSDGLSDGNALYNAPGRRPRKSLSLWSSEVFHDLVVHEGSIGSRILGELVMDHLKDLDQVAYVRFASVYRSFQDIAEFRDAIERLEAEPPIKAVD